MAPSFRCGARVFPPLRRHAEPMRRFVVLRRVLLNRDVLWEIFSCSGRSCMVIPVVVTTIEIVPMKRTPSISGTSTTCSTTRYCTRLPGTCCTPSKICGKRTATICSTTICFRLVTSHGTRGTQHHNMCYDVYRAPCELHDNLSEDVADASNEVHSQVDRSEKSVCHARCVRFTRRLLQDCSPGAPPTPMTGCYDFRRAWRPTPGHRPGTSASRPRHSRGSPPRLRGHPAWSVLSRAGLAVLFLLLEGQQMLQNATGLVALWCVPLTGTARQERKVWNDHHRKLFIEHSSQRPRQQRATHLASFFSEDCLFPGLV